MSVQIKSHFLSCPGGAYVVNLTFGKDYRFFFHADGSWTAKVNKTAYWKQVDDRAPIPAVIEATKVAKPFIGSSN